ncbi:MAG: hypothetical protein GY815_13245 [Gammaproteobacteria bacterium]|nr:hypothetical protein [Gammaproteobacteria bacterium]
MKISLKNGVSLFAAIAVAIVIAYFLAVSKSPLEHQATSLPSRSVQTIEAAEIPFRARVTAGSFVVSSH